MKDGKKILDKDEYRTNLRSIAIAISDLFKPMIGGTLLKLVEDPHGNFVLTRDGKTFIHEMVYRSKNPIYKYIYRTGEMQATTCGDLSKSTVLMTSLFLIVSLDLIELGVHPAHVRRTLSLLREYSSTWLDDRAIFNRENAALMEARLENFLSTRLSDKVARHLTALIVPFLKKFINSRFEDIITSLKGRRLIYSSRFSREFFRENLDFILSPGNRILDSRLINGMVIKKKPVNDEKIINFFQLQEARSKPFKVAVISGKLYFEPRDHDNFEMNFSTVESFQRFMAGKDVFLEKRLKKLRDLGVRVLFTEKGISDELLSSIFALDPPVLVFRRVKKDEMVKIARYSGARVVHDLIFLDEQSTGEIDAVEVYRNRNDLFYVIRQNAKDDFKTLIIRGAIREVCENVQEYIESAIQSELNFVAGHVNRYPLVLVDLVRDFLNFIGDKGTSSMPPKVIYSAIHLSEVLTAVIKTELLNEGKDPDENENWLGMPVYKAPVRTIKSMIELSTTTAMKLINIDHALVKMVHEPKGEHD
ncbi:MAG: TCP-1/cpn60 chaperonin family protein [Promethearchaeota archaeon]